ncbi:Uncharacterised protein [Mycobacteroides abscessus subsp. massiliense]|nr:Uncharacterised protein [Mycobacteroides abscessus subsp. massiliense]
MPQQLRSHPFLQHRDQILGHHVSAAGLHLHGQTEWNICHMAFECRFYTTDSGRTEQRGRIGSHRETNSRYHAIQTDPLMRHPIQGGPPHPGQQVPEAFVSAWPHTQREDVAKVPDAATRMGIEGRHRRGHDEVIGVCVPMQQNRIRRQQHRMGRGTRIARKSLDLLHHRFGKMCGTTRRLPIGWHHRTVGPRKL